MEEVKSELTLVVKIVERDLLGIDDEVLVGRASRRKGN